MQKTKSLEFLVSLRDNMESKSKNQQLELTMISDNSYDIFTCQSYENKPGFP